MKLHSLVSAVAFGTAVLVQAQIETPKPVGRFTGGGGGGEAPVQKQRGQTSEGSFDVGGDPSSSDRMETLILSAGPLEKVVTEVQRNFKDSPTKPDAFLPNIVYFKDARDAVVPGELTLRRVTPMQALALVVTAADCALEPIFAPTEAVDRKAMTEFGSGEAGAGASPSIIGYRIVMASALNRRTSPDELQLAGLAQRLATMRSSYGENHPSVVALRERIKHLEVEGVEEAKPLSGVGLALANKDGGVVVGQIIPGSPASLSPAIQPGQRIVSVAEAGKEDVDVTGFKLQKVVQLIRGTPGTPVKITFSTDTDKGPTNHVVSLARAKLPVQPSDGSLPVARAVDADSGWSGNDLLRYTATMPADNNRQFVRVYALGTILNNDEAHEKHRRCQDLIQMTLHQAALDSKITPDLSFHPESRVLVVKATAAQHEMIGQLIKALKENETQPTAPAKP